MRTNPFFQPTWTGKSGVAPGSAKAVASDRSQRLLNSLIGALNRKPLGSEELIQMFASDLTTDAEKLLFRQMLRQVAKLEGGLWKLL